MKTGRGNNCALAGLALMLSFAIQSYASDSPETCKGGWPGEEGIPLIVTVGGRQADGADWNAVVKVSIDEIRDMSKLEMVADVFDLVFELDDSAVKRLREMIASVTNAGITDTSLNIDVCDEPFSVTYRPVLKPGETTMRVAGEGSTWGVTAARADELIVGVGF